MTSFQVSLVDTLHAVMLNFFFAFNYRYFWISKEVCNSLLARGLRKLDQVYLYEKFAKRHFFKDFQVFFY